MIWEFSECLTCWQYNLLNERRMSHWGDIEVQTMELLRFIACQMNSTWMLYEKKDCTIAYSNLQVGMLDHDQRVVDLTEVGLWLQKLGMSI
jgi:hypothetical protein